MIRLQEQMIAALIIFVSAALMFNLMGAAPIAFGCIAAGAFMAIATIAGQIAGVFTRSYVIDVTFEVIR